MGGGLLSVHSQEEMNLVIEATADVAHNFWTGFILQGEGDYHMKS